MAFDFDPNKALAPVAADTTEIVPRNFEDALKYINSKLAEFESDGHYPWITETDDGAAIVRVTLERMPLYWNMTPVVKNGVEQTVDIKNPDLSVRETRPLMIGATMYPVTSKSHGMEMLHALASGKNDGLNEVLKRGADALAVVIDVERPDIEERAKILWKEKGWEQKFGPYDEQDEQGAKPGTKRFSTKKGQKRAQMVNTATDQLGYTRAKVIADKE